MRADLRRRSVLAAAAAAVPLAAAGCKGVGALGTPPTTGPDVAVLQGRDPHGAGADRPVPGGYGRVAGTGRHARPAARPAPRAPGPADVDAHRAVQPRGHPAGLPSVSAPAGTGSPPAATLAALEADENAAASSQAGRLALAPPALAQLLASIAASEASHALLLRTHRAAG